MDAPEVNDVGGRLVARAIPSLNCRRVNHVDARHAAGRALAAACRAGRRDHDNDRWRAGREIDGIAPNDRCDVNHRRGRRR